jgi:aspartyl-tRNA(Asn)/glutamyl-tRNA(Gln) amidotransferase subunit C
VALTDNEVKQIAHLARIAISPTRVSAYRDDLTRILELFESLAEIDTTGVEPMAHPLDLEQRLRPDEVTETDERALYQSVAPNVENGLYIVPKVLE